MSKLPLYCNKKDIQHDLIIFGYDDEKAGLDNYQVHSNNFENLKNMMKRMMMLYLNYLVKADKAVTNLWKK